jgi:2-hydroxycyclohexanecarboxyl-CoA dehydrogenase
MSTSPSGRVALVTGGARGIGAAIARGLAEDGMPVVIADIRAEQAQANAQRIIDAGGQALALTVDVRSPDSVAEGIERALGEFGQVDVLVNVAGWDELKPFVESDEEFWQEVLEVNFKGGLRFTRALLPAMIERHWGRIVNISSDAGRVGSSLESVYAGAKGARRPASASPPTSCAPDRRTPRCSVTWLRPTPTPTRCSSASPAPCP